LASVPNLNQWLQQIWYGGRPPPWYLRWLARCYGWLLPTHSRHSARHRVPLVVVGNLVAGGSGKTPLVIHLAGFLQQSGLRVAVISRIYRGSAKGPELVHASSRWPRLGDEPLLLKQQLSCPVVISRKRYQAYDYIINNMNDIDVVISDDGLQHGQLHADIRIAVIDGKRGFGNGLLLPAGPLREPLTRLQDMHHIVIKQTREQVPEQGQEQHQHNQVMAVLGKHLSASAHDPEPHSMLLHSSHAVRLADGQQRPLASFAGSRVQAIAAIADPDSFFDMLRTHGMQLQAHPLPDHSAVPQALWRHLATDQPVLITAKDAVKVAVDAHPQLWYVPVVTSLPEPFLQALLQQCRELLCRAA
jgi:tetraacyldisaccharide 4'-kinase